MKYAIRILVLTSTLLPLLAAAQLGNGVVAQVPFEFTVANHVVPAGDWLVQWALPNTKGTVQIRNLSGKEGLFVPVLPDEAPKARKDCALVFHRYGQLYFLAGIATTGSHTIYRLRETKAEAELRARNMTAAEENIIASMK